MSALDPLRGLEMPPLVDWPTATRPKSTGMETQFASVGLEASNQIVLPVDVCERVTIRNAKKGTAGRHDRVDGERLLAFRLLAKRSGDADERIVDVLANRIGSSFRPAAHDRLRV